MTTRTIMAQFVRKYSLISGISDEFLLRLFVFLPVKIAEPVHLQGGTISFFYALHALPCVGFRAELDGKSVTYSSDTLYDPGRLLGLQERGIISEARRQWLLHRGSVQQSDLLLHEAGVPPIHTPAAPLLALPDEVRANLRIIHVSDKRAAEDFKGIEMVRSGFENTISVPVPVSPYAHSTNILQMLLSTDLFRSLDASTAIDFLQVVRVTTYNAGDVICRTGDPPDFLRILQSGTVQYERDGFSRELRYCDYFGEVSMLTDEDHLATATATSHVEMVEVSRDSFTHLLGTRPLLKERVMRRSRLRYTESWRAIAANSVFATFSMAQVTQLQSVMQEETIQAGQLIWRRGDIVSDVILVGEGKFHFKELKLTATQPFMQGALLADVFALEQRKPHRLTFAALTDGKIFRIGGSDLLEFLDNNPGLFIFMQDSVLVE